MSSSSPHLSEELFQCFVCLDVFTHPVSLPCGHTFCQSCVLAQWTASGASHCPKCSTVFQETPDICENSFAREMAEQIRKQRGQRPFDPHPVISHNILCDMCSKDKASLAVKSCLVCVASYCEEHVISHTSRFIKHALVQPQRRMDERICRIHERPLELYCRYDQTCVCVQCTNTEHDTHHTIPVEREWEERKIQLLKTQSELKRMIKERKRKVKELKHSIKLSKENTDREMANSLEVFSTLLQFIEKRQNELIQSMKHKQKAAEKTVQKLIKELELEITKLNTTHSELEKLSCSEDHLQLIQSFPKASVVPQCKSWSQISVQTSQGPGLLREALTDTEELMLTQIHTATQKELEEISQYTVDLTLDPDTANPWLVLSEDRKCVSDGNVEGSFPNNAQRFDTAPCVLSKEPISRGRNYWEVGVSNKTAWDLGVAKRSVNRKGLVTLSPANGYWAVCLRGGNEYRACDHESFLLSPRTRPQKIGIFVDFEEGRVSFYDTSAYAHMYSFSGHCFNEDLLAYFNPDMNDAGNNKGPLVIKTANLANGATFDIVTI